MTRVVRHPLVREDLRAIARHVLEVSGDPMAALRRLDEIDALIADISRNPGSGTRLSGALDGWLVRHGGARNRLTVVFRHDPAAGAVFVALVAFGGQDWEGRGAGRRWG